MSDYGRIDENLEPDVMGEGEGDGEGEGEGEADGEGDGDGDGDTRMTDAYDAIANALTS